MLENIRETLTPFLWGGALALLLNMPLRAVENHLTRLRPRARRIASLAVVLLGFAFALFLGLWLLIPQLLAALLDVSAILPQAIAQWQSAAARLFANMGQGGEILAWVFGEAAQLRAASEEALSQVIAYSVALAATAATGFARLVLSLVLAVYLLASKENLAHKADLVARALLGDKRAAIVRSACARAAAIFAAFVIGQCLEAAILASLFVLVLFASGMPYVLPIAAVIGVTAFVPVFGSIFGSLVGLLLVASVAPEKTLWFIVIFFAIQQCENNFIYPRVVGGRVNLPPLWVVVAIILGGGFFGVPGLLLGIPMMSVVYQIGGDWVHARTKSTDGEGLAS